MNNQEFRKCEICGKTMPVEDFSKSYKHRCKECVARLQRESRKAKRIAKEDVSAIKLSLDRKKMQACQIYPRTIVVPYDTAVNVINQVIEFFSKQRRPKEQTARTKDGRKVRILCKNRAFTYPIVGLVQNGKKDECWEALACWDIHGRFNGEEDKHLDLIMEE